MKASAGAQEEIMILSFPLSVSDMMPYSVTNLIELISGVFDIFSP